VHLGKVNVRDFMESVFTNLVDEKLELSIQIVLEKSFYMIKNFFSDEKRIEMRQKMFTALL
jgi:hypothetical protein